MVLIWIYFLAITREHNGIYHQNSQYIKIKWELISYLKINDVKGTYYINVSLYVIPVHLICILI